ncbi:MAG: VCBS repeat-containing protein [Candidatus Glassbacteria bacterium]|nr:VCBS repeat-containing protein [Candidatus Glassbacteria bacterium]
MPRRTLHLFLICPAVFLLTCNRNTPAPSLQFTHLVVDETPLQEGWGGMDDCNVVDFDGDGDLDIWFSGNTDLKPGSREAYLIEWYRNPGRPDAAWERLKIHPGNYLGATVGDVDGDGDRDIISGRDYGTGRFVWLENTGDFQQDWPEHSIREDMPFHPDEVHTGDLNRDGRIDIVTATFRTHLFFLPGPKDPRQGPWDLHLVASSEEEHGGAALADLDRDGDRDIVWGNAWYENPGDPAQTPWTRHVIDPGWTTGTKVAVGDLTHDSRMEIVLSGEESSDGIAWYRAPEDPGEAAWTRYLINGQYQKVHSLQLADFDLDGDLDLLAAEMHHTEGQHRVTVFECLDIQRNLWKENVVAVTGSHNAKVGDVNGDGLPDVVGKNWGGDLKAEIWLNATPAASRLTMNNWTYIQADSGRAKWGDFNQPEWMKYFGLAMGDLTGDGCEDIVSGRYFYRSPGGGLTGTWQRADFGFNVDGNLIVDVDGDEFADVIGEALPDVFWLEAGDSQCSTWKARKIGSVPATEHVNGQGYRVAQLIPGGRPEIILAGGEDANEIYFFEIPEKPDSGDWPRTLITAEATDEGIGLGDMDGDGDLDLCSGDVCGGGKNVAWWANPGDGSGDWKKYVIGTCYNWPDRMEAADINGDGRPDIILSEEWVLDGCHVFWYEQPDAGPCRPGWTRHLITEQYTTNSLDVADVDRDGDIDIITAEHRGTEKLAIWENLDRGRAWVEHVISCSRESHLGAQTADLDNDGDLDLVSIAWDDYRYLHLWRNDAK